MGIREGRTCPNRERLAKRVEQLEAQLAQALARIAELEEQLAKASKDSKTSSKPPSSDIVKPKKKNVSKKKKRKRGGQPGHPQHKREPFQPEEIDLAYEYYLRDCPDCGHKLMRSKAEPQVIQQAEIPDRPLQIVEHRGLAHWCPRTPCCARRAAAAGDTKIRLAGATLDNLDRVHERGLPRFVFHDSQVLARRPWDNDFSRPVGQDHCESERSFGRSVH